MTRPETPAQIAAALRVIADQLDTLDPDRRLHVTLDIQPDLDGDAATVDAVSVALFGIPARDQQLKASTGWMRSTSLSAEHRHRTGLSVDTFTTIKPPPPSVEQVAAAALTPDAEPIGRGTRTDPQAGRACGCWSSPENAEGPHPDCPVHGVDRSAEVEQAEAASPVSDRSLPPQVAVAPTYPSPAPIADVEQAIKEYGGDDPQCLDDLIAQRDIWEDHARIAHRQLDELRDAVRLVVETCERSYTQATLVLTSGFLGEVHLWQRDAASILRKALGGQS